MIWIVDRIEGDQAIVGCGDLRFDVPIAALPAGLGEGDAVQIGLSDAAEATQAAAKARIAALTQADDGEDFSL